MRYFLSLVLSFILIGAYGQESNFTVFNGRILDAENGSPVLGKISFSMLPDGNDKGSITSDNSGAFTFYMRKRHSYSITVKAEGYLVYAQTIQEDTVTADQSIVYEIKLKPGGEGSIFRLEHLNFQQGSAVINKESFKELDELALMMKDNPKMEIQLEGHTDYQGGGSEGNMRLSQMRVDACKNYLVSKNINPKRILTKAFGGTQPILREDTPEAHALNRRVEVRIIKME